MSLILDALNRSEAERRGGGEVPGLATEHFSGSEGDKFKLRVYLPWLALAVAVAVIAWLVLDRTGGEPGAVTPTVPVTATDETTSPRRPVPVARPPEEPAGAVDRQQRPVAAVPKEAVAAAPGLPAGDRATPSATPVDASVAALYRRSPAATDAPAAVIETSKSAARVDAAAAVPSAAEEAKIMARSPASPRVSEPLDIEAALASAREEMENAQLVDHPAPFIQDLSQQRKNAIPTLMYSIHNYSGKAGQSSVMINGKSLRAGANVGKGVKLEEILPESIVLSHQGEQFRLRALNSWVNL